jgi:hypothetical protein
MRDGNKEIILITRADDMDYTHTGDLAILDCLRNGIIKSAKPRHVPGHSIRSEIGLVGPSLQKVFQIPELLSGAYTRCSQQIVAGSLFSSSSQHSV